MIESNLRKPRNAEEKGILFSENGIFGTLSEKINGAYFMSLIGPETKRQCHIIRSIRNEVAHNMNSVSFQSQHIMNKCNQLSSLERLAEAGVFTSDKIVDTNSPKGAKLRFVSAVSLIAIQCMIYSGLGELSESDRAKYEEMKADDVHGAFLRKNYILL